MQSKMGYVLLMVAVMIGSRVCGVEATITCANTDGANLEYDCGMVDDLIDENPSSIECSDQQSQCTSDECCTVAPTPVDCVQSVQPAAADCTSQCGTERGTVTTEPTYNGVQCVEYDCQAGDGDCPAVVDCVESGNTAADCTADCTTTYTETTAASGGGIECTGARACEAGDGECPAAAVVDCVESGNTAADCTADCTATYTETTAASGGGIECTGARACEAGDGECPAAAVVDCVESGNTAADCTADCTATYTETTAASGGGTACVGAYTCESGDGDCFSCTSYAAVDEDDSSWTASGVETCEEGVKFCVFVKVDDIAGIACDGGADEVSVCEQAAFKEGCSVTRNEMVLTTKCFDSDQGVTSYADYKSTMDDITKKCDGVGAHGLNAAVLMLALFGYSFSQ